MTIRTALVLGLAALLAWGPATPAGNGAMPVRALALDGDSRADQDFASVRRGVSDLFAAAQGGHPSLLQDAEREVVAGLLDGLEAANTNGHVDANRYARVLAGYDEANHLFKELPYTLEVDPGDGLRPFSLPLRRHPWWDLSAHPIQGWQAELIESGARLVARGT